MILEACGGMKLRCKIQDDSEYLKRLRRCRDEYLQVVMITLSLNERAWHPECWGSCTVGVIQLQINRR